MIPEERLTAYALNDSSLSAAERAEVEAHLAGNEADRRSVSDTRRIAAMLGEGLAKEAAPGIEAKANPAAASRRGNKWLIGTAAALVASLLIAFGFSMYGTFNKPQATAALATQSHKESVTVAKLNGDYIGHPPVAERSAPVAPKYWQGGIAGNNGGISGGISGNGGGIMGGVVTRSGDGELGSSGEYQTVRGAIADSRLLPPTLPGINGAGKPGESEPPPPVLADIPYRERLFGPNASRFPTLEENAFIRVEGQGALSTFGADVDTASYSIVRKFLSQNQLPPAGAVRLEEMVNYFPYRDAAPTGDDPFAVTVEVAECPWNAKNRLARIGLKAKPIDFDKRPPSNLVFLIDISGSMMPPERLPLVKQSLKLLVNQLGENDRVALMVYASGTGVVLDSTSAARKNEIIAALDRLEAGGSTNGSGGIQLAYEVAVRNFLPNGTNRVILCTDGDWNVGVTSTDALMAMIEEKRKSNVFLSVFGFGFGNLRDEMMVKLADKGNGNYAYIDSLREARKAFVDQAGGTLVTVAKDVKIQVEFNPAKVGSYRLLGYEKRILAAKDFHDDTKDAGEMGAGHVVTALYELTPPGTESAPGVDGLRYQGNATPAKNDSKEAFVVKLRHKLPASEKSTLREVPVLDSNKPYGAASEDFRFAAAVASFAMLLRDSPHKGNATYSAVQELAQAAMTHDPSEYRAEFVKLVTKAKQVAGKP